MRRRLAPAVRRSAAASATSSTPGTAGGDRRRWPRRARRGTSRGPARRPAASRRLRGLEEQRRGVASRAGGRTRSAPRSSVELGTLEFVQRAESRPPPAARARRRARRPANLACAAASARCARRRRVGGQLGRPLQERGRRRDAAARLRPLGRALQLGGDRLVGSGRRVGQVPRAPVGIDVRDRSPRPARGARPAGPATPPRGRRPSARADGGNAPGHRARSAPPPRPAPPRPAPIPSSSAARRSRVTSPTGSAAAMSSSCCVSAGSDWTRRRKLCSIWLASGRASGSPNPPASSAGVSPAGQLEQGQRVPARLGDDPVPHPLVESPRNHRVQQRASVAVARAPRAAAPAAPSTRARARARARRTPARPAPRAGVARRTRGSAPRPGRATARRRRGRRAAAPRPRRRAG